MGKGPAPNKAQTADDCQQQMLVTTQTHINKQLLILLACFVHFVVKCVIVVNRLRLRLAEKVIGSVSVLMAVVCR